MEPHIPPYALALIRKLQEAGFSAWAVGGCVRDSLLGLAPHDWDLCTTAMPKETAAVFTGYPLVRAGEKHGTIGVCTEMGVVEITTLRREGGYADGRHPSWVEFVPSLREDLARRDFTVNAMAWGPEDGLHDPFGGQEDLKNGILRAVGDPETRFQEDGLRILRGLRFSARFSLTVEENTRGAMLRCAQLLSRIAPERLFAELTAALPYLKAEDLIGFSPVVCAVIPELGEAVGFHQHNPHHSLTVYDHIAHVVQAAPPKIYLRLAALLHDVGKPRCYTMDENGVGHFRGHAQMGAEMAGEILTRLRCPNGLKAQVVTLVQWHGACRCTTEKGVRRLLRALGPETVRDLVALDRADCHGKPTDDHQEIFDEFEEILNRVLEQDACFSLKDLALSGRDLLALGIAPGPKVGLILNTLLDRVAEGSLLNNREALLEAAKALL